MSFLFSFDLALFASFLFLMMIPSSFANAKIFNDTHSPIIEDNHSNKCNASQYQRASPIGQGTRKEEGLTTDYGVGEMSSPWCRRRLELMKRCCGSLSM